MIKHVGGGLLLTLALIIASSQYPASTAMARTAHDALASAQALDRDLEPVVVRGQMVDAMAGAPVSQLFVYSYAAGMWHQIPAQVDEVTASGAYVALEDGLLDGNDEIVFMARDLDDRVPSGTSPSASLPGVSNWYEIQVTDPIDPSHQGWAYLVQSSVLVPTSAADYVSFDAQANRLIGENYSLGFMKGQAWANYLTLGSSTVNILDRSKIRVCVGGICLRTEENVLVDDTLIKDGPVRAIIRDGRITGYGSLVTWSTSIPEIPAFPQFDLRVSVDFLPVVTGATLYSAVAPAGLLVDGVPETMSSQPVSTWSQLSTSYGTWVQAVDIASVGGTQSNYYRDSSALDLFDTGDKRHYGDVGLEIKNPNQGTAFTYSFYVLPGTQPNIGATYDAFLRKPLLVMVSRYRTYLPLVVRQG